MKISNEFMLKNIAGNYVVIPVGEKTLNFNAIMSLNELGAFIFNHLLSKDLNIDELVELICAEYEVNADVAYKDCKTFIDKLKVNNILVAEDNYE